MVARKSWRCAGSRATDRVEARSRSEHRGGAGSGDSTQAEDAEVPDRGREVADMAADEAEGKASVRVAPAAASPEAEVPERPGSGRAEAEPVVEAEPPAHPHTEHAVPVTRLDPAQLIDRLGREEAAAVRSNPAVRQ